MIQIEKVSEEDIDTIFKLKEEIWNTLERKDFYEVKGITKEFLFYQFNNDGVLLKCVDHGKMIGFLIAKRKLKPNSEILKTLDYEKIEDYIEMSNMGILTNYRGNHLQQKMIQEAEKIMKEKAKNIKYSIAGIHPENKASLKSFLNLGYKIIEKVKMYEGKDRVIVLKSL